MRIVKICDHPDRKSPLLSSFCQLLLAYGLRLFRGDPTGKAVLMRHYIRKTEKELFNPVELAELVGAYQKACHSICRLGGIVDEKVRRLLARRIIEKAKSGELDQDRLCQVAMDHLAVTLLTLHLPAGLSTPAAP